MRESPSLRCSWMASASSRNCSLKNSSCVARATGIFSKLECVTITASQLPVAMHNRDGGGAGLAGAERVSFHLRV